MRFRVFSLPRAQRRSLTLWGLAGVLVAAAVLRFAYLTDRSLWFDEAFSWRLIQFPFGEFLERAAADVHPILYYLVLWLWALPLSLLNLPLSLSWLRALSVVLSLATVAVMYVAGAILFRSRWTGLTAALLTAVSAFQVQYAWEARMYALGTFLLPLALLLLILTTRALTRAWAWWYGILFGLVTGALLHVHYYTIFSWLALGATKLLFFLWQMRRGVRPVLRLPSFHAAEVGFWLSGVIYLPWLPVFLEQSRRVQENYWIPPISLWSIPNTMARLFLGGATEPSRTTAIVSTLVVLALLLVPLLRGRTRSDLLLVLSFAIPFLGSWWLSQRTSIYQDRYFVFAALPLILLLARSVSFLPSRTRLAIVIILAVGGLGSVIRFWQQLDFPRHLGARGAAEFLLDQASPGEPIMVSSSFVYFPMAFHLGCQMRGIRNEKQEMRMPPGDSRCVNNLDARLYSEDGQLIHFAGGPIIVAEDIAGPDAFRRADRLWVVDTTGFGGSRLAVLPPFTLAREQAFSELYGYQGDILVREYVRMSP